MTKHNPPTCTVQNATTGACGEDAVWSDGTFAECEEHAAQHGSLAKAKPAGPRVGDEVDVHRHGKTYVGRVVEVGARGAVYAKVTYGNGATRRVRV